MGYQTWPWAAPPYAPLTYITDGRTPVNKQSLENGISRDIAAMQYHINTTNLIASGYNSPIVNGYFKNIDALYLYAAEIDSTVLTLNNIVEPYISHLKFSSNYLYTIDSAFVGNNLQVADAFKGPGFFLNSSGFLYNAPCISGNVWNYYLNTNTSSQFLNGEFNNLIVSGNIFIDGSHSVIVESVQGFSPIGTISESGLYYDGFGGHDHKLDNIIASNILSGDMTNFGDLIINTNQASISLVSGLLNANKYNLQTNYDESDFYVLDYSVSGCYSGYINYPGTVTISGNIIDLNIGMEKMIVVNDKVWALSSTLPTGCLDTRKTFIYNTNDFYNWNAILISGQFSLNNTYINASGIASITDMIGFDNDINSTDIIFLWNMSVISGNYCAIHTLSNLYNANGGQHYGIANCAYKASRYGTGLSIIDGNIYVYGYEYPHINTSGIGQWDKHGLFWSNVNDTQANCSLIIPTSGTSQDISFSGVAYNYSYPFIHVFPIIGVAINQQPNYYWLDGSQNGRDGCLTTVQNGSVYSNIPGNSPNYSGFYASFFGNGFSEITSLLSLDGYYHAGMKGVFTYQHDISGSYKTLQGKFDGPDIIDNSVINPILVFGNYLSQVNTSTGDNIFGGCIPIMMNLDRRLSNNSQYLYLTSGIASYSPCILHGAKSLMDDNYLFRLPTSLYYQSILRSNLWAQFTTSAGRLWTDASDFDGNTLDDFDTLYHGTATYISNNLNQKDCHVNICPWQPGLGVTPFGGSGQMYYMHDSENNPTKINYISLLVDQNAGLIIPSGTFSDRNLPTYYDRPSTKGFWSSKTFDWFYNPYKDIAYHHPGYSGIYNPPSGSYSKTYYYMKPKLPLQHNGVVYCILENNTGFIYTGPDGPSYIDDGIMYSDLIKFGNVIYGVGCKVTSGLNGYNYTIVLNTINRNISTPVSIPPTNNGLKKTPKFVVYRNSLYIGLGGGIFLVKKPDHIDMCIATNI